MPDQILVVEEDPGLLKAVKWALEEKGYEVTASSLTESGLKELHAKKFDLVITGCPEILAAARTSRPEGMVITFTGERTGVSALDALRLDADDCLLRSKVFDLFDLWKRVDRCLERKKNKDLIKMEEKEEPLSSEKMGNIMKAMAHDVRGALVSILADLKLIERGAFGFVGEEVGGRLKMVKSKVSGVACLSEEYLTAAFAVDEGSGMPQEIVDLGRDVLCPVLQELSSEIEESGIVVHNFIRYDSSQEIPVRGNAIWLKTVFRNLIRNAVKYGGRGCAITIGAEKRVSECVVSVFNNGISIPEDRRNRIFKEFEHYESSGNENGEGIGLGLFLVKKVVQMHKGRIWCEAGDQGSNFVFTLPVCRLNRKDGPVSGEHGLRGDVGVSQSID